VKAYVTRFSRSERTFHWVNATFFLYLLGTGLVLFLPQLSRLVGRRPLMKDLHFWGGIGWIAALALVALLGDSRGLWRTLRELETLDHRRFNPGQKVNAILNAAITVLFVISGLLLWLGERDTRFRLQNTVTLHDTLMYGALALLAGHLYLAVIHPTTRHALRGMTRGTVSEEWARRHHPRWEVPPSSGPPEGPAATTTDVART
jgi:formate dehydrogenase subunit gamma